MQSKKLNEINYTPLQYMNGVTSRVLKDMFKLPPFLTIVLIVAAVIVSFYYVGQLGFIVGALLYGAVAAKVLEQKAKIWRSFAEVNGWYVVQAAANDPRYIPPGIYGQGRSQKIGDIIHVTFEGHECDVFMYQFTTGSGKQRQTHYYTVARVLLDRPFPHLILDSRKSWALRNRGEAHDSVKLEGDFNKHFSLYFRKDDHINALSIITPDIMQTLINSNTPQDIEIIDNNLYFMIASDERTAQSMAVLLASVDALADQIKHKAKTIQYQPPITPQARLLAQVSAEYINGGTKVMNSLLVPIVIALSIPFILMFFIGLIVNLSKISS